MARKILLADDSVTAQNMGRKILSDAGYEVITVNNGSAALKKVNDAKPDVIVLDVYMPGYSGLEVCQRLKEVAETARIPILLTVGKLEPFKPEEAKRCKADAFIVKPFEASELLSAISKLEDKIVPRPEAHKPGRFARAIAAVEEGRYDKSMAVEEDEGWKNRIKFPSKKKEKEKPAEEDVDEAAYYNPMNKDLRTTVEHAPPRRPEPPKEEAPRVDLGALASQGLPKDVTPEEIAALAAAAAQIKGTGAGNHEPEKASEPQRAEEPAPGNRPAEVAAAAPPASEPVPEPVAAQPAAQPEAAAPAVAPLEVAAAVTAPAPAAEEKLEQKAEIPPAEIPQEPAAAAPVAEAEQKVQEQAKAEVAKAEVREEKSSETEAPSFAARPSDEVVAPPPFVAAHADSGNGFGAHAPADEPMTMAAAAGADFASRDSRWMAVPVALLPEEAALSLEQEMHKSIAAFAAAEAANSLPAPVADSKAVAVAEPPAETPAAEPAAPATEGLMPEVARTMSSVASVAAEAIKAAVKEFEHVAASLVETKAEAPAESKPEPVPAPEPVVESVPVVEAKTETPANAQSSLAEPEAAKAQNAPETVVEEPRAEPKLEAETKQEPDRKEEPQAAVETAVAAPAEISTSVKEAEKEAPAVASEAAAEPASATQITPQITDGSENVEPAAGGTSDMAKKEQEAAAAWASWRRIRETGKGPAADAGKKEAEEAPQEKDEAAMAVAAGAEKAPEEARESGESDEIASIVDSVLADMRPKIVEEISKKMGKKKK